MYKHTYAYAHIHTHIYNLLSQFNVVCMHMSKDDYFALDNLYWSLLVEEIGLSFLGSHCVPVALHLAAGLCVDSLVHIGQSVLSLCHSIPFQQTILLRAHGCIFPYLATGILSYWVLESFSASPIMFSVP